MRYYFLCSFLCVLVFVSFANCQFSLSLLSRLLDENVDNIKATQREFEKDQREILKTTLFKLVNKEENKQPPE